MKTFSHRYEDDLTDREECDCLNDCEMVHFFSTMQRQPYSETSVAQSNSQTWFDMKNGSPSGALVNYLMDPKHIFTSEMAKNITKLANNLSHDYELAQKRFEEVSLEKLKLVILVIWNNLRAKNSISTVNM